jgi:hypothetical protein
VVAERFADNGFPHAEPVGAGRAGSDIVGLVGIDVEVKARRDLNLVGLMKQLDARAKDGVLGIGVVRPDGMGETTVGMWPAVMCLDDLIALLRAAGYGTPLEET